MSFESVPVVPVPDYLRAVGSQGVRDIKVEI